MVIGLLGWAIRIVRIYSVFTGEVVGGAGLHLVQGLISGSDGGFTLSKKRLKKMGFPGNLENSPRLLVKTYSIEINRRVYGLPHIKLTAFFPLRPTTINCLSLV